MTDKILKVHNQNNLPTMPYTEFVEFQGDLKNPITPEDLKKICESLKKHGVFVPKFVWFDEQQHANILDGHQTKQALSSLEDEGWEIPEIPYVNIEASNRQDAAEKLLQINSRYATMNPHTTWFDNLDFPDISELLEQIQIPEISTAFLENVETLDWDTALDKVPDKDRQPFQQMTFTLHDSQVETIQRALQKAKHDGKQYFEVSENENQNGNALAFICETYGQG